MIEIEDRGGSHVAAPGSLEAFCLVGPFNVAHKFSLMRFGTGSAQIKRACRVVDEQALVLMVASEGFEPPTKGL